MKKGIVILFLILLILIPLSISKSETTNESNPIKNIDIKQFAKDNPWNQTVIISPTWQKLIGGLFGLNFHNESTEISVRETIVFIAAFIMFLVIILDILKITPLFKEKIFGTISIEFLAALIITIIVSITGVFINIKNLFISGIAYLIVSLDWQWLTDAIANKGWGIFLTIVIVIPIIIIVHEIISLFQPIIKKYSEVSRAEAKGRILETAVEQASHS